MTHKISEATPPVSASRSASCIRGEIRAGERFAFAFGENWSGFSYPTTSTMAFFRAGYPVAYLPIRVGRRVGKSHIRPVKDGLRFLLIIFRIGTLYSPLKLFIPVAGLFFALGIAWYGYTYLTMGRFTNMSALLMSGSSIIFMMGLISEQITALMYKSGDRG